MALNAKLELRQSQSLVMTPQLQQAIKLLQFSHVELASFIEQELEKNPLLSRDERDDTSLLDPAVPTEPPAEPDAEASQAPLAAEETQELSLGTGAEDFAHTGEIDADLDSLYPEAGAASANDFIDSGLAAPASG